MWTPSQPPQNATVEGLTRYIVDELQRLAADLAARSFDGVLLAETNVAPSRPREGQVVFADGTNWNPGGTGRGIYAYYGSAWVKL